ncbi:alpha/beta hydrolase [Rhodoferax aquaticus]|uniref:Alpha/beta hydrolase n=2 Tax=Rhodoferax aquaticus TaxID=2527691 RepID=A0A515EVH9_9BURK|nr:alpha/beta hydrolase [Rhodoferax aquaticus]
MTRSRWARIVYGALCAALLSACNLQSVFFQPDDVLYSTPGQQGLKYEDLVIVSPDGTKLAAWFIPAIGVASPREAKGTVVHLHGNAQNMSAHWNYVAWLPAKGYNLLVFDYRGYGASQGEPDLQGVFDDSNAALNYVRNRKDMDPNRLLVLGQSLGGTNAIAAVGSGNRAGVKAMVIDATFYSYSAIASDKVSGAGALMDDRYSAANFIERIAPIPLLLLHGTADAVIPYSHAQRLLAKAREPKQLLTIDGAGHIEALSPRYGSVYQEAVLAFFAKALDATQSAVPGP